MPTDNETGYVIDVSAAVKDRISNIESELRDLRNILQKISDKLQDGGEFDDELHRLLFGI